MWKPDLYPVSVPWNLHSRVVTTLLHKYQVIITPLSHKYSKHFTQVLWSSSVIGPTAVCVSRIRSDSHRVKLNQQHCVSVIWMTLVSTLFSGTWRPNSSSNHCLEISHLLPLKSITAETCLLCCLRFSLSRATFGLPPPPPPPDTPGDISQPVNLHFNTDNLQTSEGERSSSQTCSCTEDRYRAASRLSDPTGKVFIVLIFHKTSFPPLNYSKVFTTKHFVLYSFDKNPAPRLMCVISVSLCHGCCYLLSFWHNELLINKIKMQMSLSAMTYTQFINKKAGRDVLQRFHPSSLLPSQNSLPTNAAFCLTPQEPRCFLNKAGLRIQLAHERDSTRRRAEIWSDPLEVEHRSPWQQETVKDTGKG